MGALLTVQDVETALGREADSEEIAEWTFYINTISDFINNYVDVAFEPQVAVTERLRANHAGQITLKSPVVEILSIKDFRSQEENQWVDWDGLNILFNLLPRQVVDVTYSYGHNVVPSDIKNLVLAAVLDQINELSSVNLRSRQVGDVREEFRGGFITQLLGETAQRTLDKYTRTDWTIDVSGADWYPEFESNQEYLNDF